MISKIPLTILI